MRRGTRNSGFAMYIKMPEIYGNGMFVHETATVSL